MRFFIGFIGIILSFLLLIYRTKVKHFIGNVEWAERRLGSGGTYTLLVLLSLFFFFISLMYMTNSFDLIFGGMIENFSTPQSTDPN